MSQTEPPFESISLTLLSFELQIWFSSQNWSEFNQEFISEVTFLLGGGGVRLQTDIPNYIYIDMAQTFISLFNLILSSAYYAIKSTRNIISTSVHSNTLNSRVMVPKVTAHLSLSMVSALTKHWGY